MERLIVLLILPTLGVGMVVTFTYAVVGSIMREIRITMQSGERADD